MTAKTRPDPALRAALAGTRALLLDMDGVIVSAGQLIPGAADAIARLESTAFPYRIVTNTSAVSRDRLSFWSRRLGADIPPERFLSALSASAAYAARHFPGQRLYVLASDDAKLEFAGQHLLTHDEAGAPGATAAAVLIGDSPEEATFENLNRAFRLILGGATLIGMHRNPWWLTPEGPTIDSGAYVSALEFAAGIKARIIGKPSPAFFALAIDGLRADVAGRGGSRLRRAEIAMVGDDIRNDVLAGQRAGLRGVFVLSGKHTADDLERARSGARRTRTPDAMAGSLADVVAALD
jgi:HAD superfamily hydrolase (TIGR01458 family)